MRIVVTGGAGFIGSHVVDLLAKAGYSVAVIDNLSTGKLSNLRSDVEFIKGEITDFDLVKALTSDADAIFHLAALPRIQKAIDDPKGTYKANVEGMFTVLEAARENQVSRFIYSSSSSIYGDQDSPIMIESMTPKPKSLYASQKLMDETLASAYANTFNMTVLSLRYFNVYGPRQLDEGDYCLVIGKFLQRKRKMDKFSVYGDGTQTRAFTHVYDIARANLLALEAEVKKGWNTIINVGTAEEVSVNQVAEAIGGEIEHIFPNPRGSFEEKRKAADYGYATTILGWRPEILFKEGIKTVL